MDDKERERMRKERAEREARRTAFFETLKKAGPRLWRPPNDGLRWLPQPETPETWNAIILQLTKDLEEVFTSAEEIIPPSEFPFVQQCKEKFGGLRFYVSGTPDPINDRVCDLISKAEAASTTICVKCATTETTQIRSHYPAPFQEHHFGWICPYCDDCFMEEAVRRAKRSGVKEMRKWHYEMMVERKAAKSKKKK